MTKTLSKRNDFNRRVRSFMKHLQLMVWPITYASIAFTIWYLLQRKGVHFPKGVPLEIVATSVLVFIVPFAMICTTAIEIAQNKSNKIVDSLLSRPPNKELFMRYRDERIRTVLHIGLIVLAVCTILMIGLFHFPAVWVGGLTVFFSTFTLTVPWTIIRELEDPHRSHWVMERIPDATWLTDDVDEFFGLTKKKEEA